MSAIASVLSEIAIHNVPLAGIGVGHVQIDPAWQITNQRHAYHELIVIIGGKMTLEINGAYMTTGVGDVLFYEAGACHSEWSDPTDPLESFFFTFKTKKLALPVQSADKTGRVRMLARWAYEERQHPAPTSAMLQESALRMILVELRRASEGVPDRVRMTQQFMHDHLRENLSLETLANAAHMSKFHFLRTYKMLTGHTPMDDLRRIRAEAARDLIRQTELPLKAVAESSGFANEFHMSRIFRKVLGVTPGQFRK